MKPDSSSYRFLAQVCTRITDGTHQTPSYQDQGVVFISAKNIKDGQLDFVDRKYITREEHQFLTKNAKPSPGDLLLTKSGSLGDVAVIPELDFEFSIFESLALLKPRRDLVDSNYLHQYIRSPGAARHFHGITTGLAVKHLHLGDLRKLKVFLPPLEHQREIAERLSTWDTATQKTEQLIAAKERSSRALMQRVFGPSAYPYLRLSEFTRRVTRKNIDGNGHPLTISGAEGLVSQSRYFGKRIAAKQTERYTLLKRGEFAYNKSYSTGYPLGAIKRLDSHDEGIVSTLYLCFALEESKAPLGDYFAYFCEAGGFNHQIYQVAQEGARNHGLLNVTAEDFFSMRMPVPPREVQERVVRALGAAMQELALLRDQLAALREQKRGLMQKLLTGQWRLPVSQDTEVSADA